MRPDSCDPRWAITNANWCFPEGDRRRLAGSTLRPKIDFHKAMVCRSLEEFVWPLFEAGSIRPVVSHEVPFDEVVRAHELLEGGKVFGKLVMKVS